ncbi:hypothetical protein L6R52_43965 [Myxococcota bacterium]|nr:hypothetical protein [Myxococcota bacterium]
MIVGRGALSGGARHLPFVAVLVAALASGDARAEVSGEEARFEADLARPSSRLATRSGLLGVSLGLGELDGDLFATLRFRLNLHREGWGLGLGLPLRFRLDDRATPAVGDHLGILRAEDWDHWSDALKILRYAYVGSPDRTGPYHARIGELHGLTIGHGSIVHRYYNGFDIDRFRLGTNARIEAGPFGAEVVASDLLRAGGDLGLAGGRLTLAPLSVMNGKGEYSDRFVVGASLMVDAHAPVELERVPRLGVGVPPPVITGVPGHTLPGSVVVDGDNIPVPRHERAVAVLGADVEYTVIDDEIVRITPYVDANKIFHGGRGKGLHLGVLWSFQFPLVVGPLDVRVRTEYRRTDGDYLAPYFGTLHEVERFDFPPGSGATKVHALRQSRDEPAHDGVFFDFLAGLPGYVYLGAEYLDRGPHARTTRLSLQLPAFEVVELRAFFYRTGVDGPGDIFAIDDGTAIVTDLKVRVYWIFSALAHWSRVWRASEAATGSYEPMDDWSLGVGVDIKL